MARFARRRPRPTIRSGHDHTSSANGLGAEHRAHLEEQLVARYRAQRVHRRRGMVQMAMQANVMRWATVAVALTLGVVACTTPTTTEVEMGHQIRFTVPADPAVIDRGDELMKSTKAIVEALESREGVEVATVDLRGSDTAVSLDLVLWGDGLDGDRLADDLIAQFPVLEGAAVEVHLLNGEVREPLYAKLSRQVLSIEIGGGSDEEIRAHILEQLRASGFGEGSDVTVQQSDGITTLQINAVGDGVEQETVIEVIGGPLPETVELGGEEGEGERVIIEKVKKQ